MSRKNHRVLSNDSLNPNLRNVTFPWPCKSELRGDEILEEIKKGIKYPFSEISNLDSANPLGMGQKPISFFQQVIAVCTNKDLLHSDLYPADVKKRARNILVNCHGNFIGSYSDIDGIPGVRKQIAKFIQRRDGGVVSKEKDVFMTNGVTEGVHVLLDLLANLKTPKPPGILIPVPEFPLYSAVIAEHGIQGVKYFLNEEKQWSVDMEDLQKSIDDSRSICDPIALVVINPGNPNGYVMTRTDIEDIIKFAYREKLFIIADEVYQFNIYNPDRPFISFKKVMSEMGPPYCFMELASLMSTSKGFMGECGIRGGYCEIVNLDNGVRELLDRLLAIRVCPSTLGQVVIYCVCFPPEPCEPSFEQYEKEKNNFLQDMISKVDYCHKKFNSLKGMSCAKVNSSMFFYPRIFLPKKALKEAEVRGLQPDELYCMELVESSGICVIPGCEFGQKPGTFHFRYSFLYPYEKNNKFVDEILKFHEQFIGKYTD